jgi:hypothetical protein
MTYVYHAKVDAIIDLIIRVAHGLNYAPNQSDLDRLAFMVTDEEWALLVHYAMASTSEAQCRELRIAGLRVLKLSTR